ncbi:MAG: four helix bundle protein [Patescibacteria group bacterium]|nr:four helix bundle protein [Patescibacteria group bacterium]
MEYDLEERTTKLVENIISLCKEISKNTITFPLIDQLVRSGTSIGANYTEANGVASKKDFRNKIILAKKEAMETKYWLRLIGNFEVKLKDKCRKLWQETHEITIFSKIIKNC